MIADSPASAQKAIDTFLIAGCQAKTNMNITARCSSETPSTMGSSTTLSRQPESSAARCAPRENRSSRTANSILLHVTLCWPVIGLANDASR